MINYMNIIEPVLFGEQLGKIFAAIYGLFEQARENTLLAEEDGVIRYFEEGGKCLFQVAGQFKRPGDFLQCFLDMLRIMFEPNPPGTWLLNSNSDFILEEIGGNGFQLGYITGVSAPSEQLSDFYSRVIEPQMQENSYVLESAFATYAFITSGDKWTMKKVSEISSFFDSGFSVDDAVQTLANGMNGKGVSKRNRSFAGFSSDKALGKSMRFSMWIFLPVLQ
jgi:hypothetical protein